MEWIDKQNEQQANGIIDEFLKQAKVNGSTKETIYDDFGGMSPSGADVSFKTTIIEQVLLPEQEHRCCYCMKQLPDHGYSTIEHIIPQTVYNQHDMNEYFGGRAGNLNASNVCLTNDYINKGFPEHKSGVRTPYPHLVSYHNFAAVCPSCNHARGSKKIDPLFLYKGIKNEVTYDQYSGEMKWENDPFYNSPEYSNPLSLEVPTVERIELNDDKIKAIRQVCFYVKRNSLRLNNINKAKREEILYETLGDICANMSNLDSFDLGAFCQLSIDFRWNELMRFDYFYK